MKDHMVDHDDLERQMKKEAREEARADLEAAWYDAMAEVDNEEQFRSELRKLHDKKREVDSDLRQLRRKVQEKEEEQSKIEKKTRFIKRKIQEQDPEVIVELHVVHPSDTVRYGEPTTTQIGWEVNKAPPVVDPNGQTKGGLPMDVSDRLKSIVERVEEDLGDLESYDNGEVVATVTFEDFNDPDPEIEL